MSQTCPDLCTRKECEELRQEIETLKADLKLLRADLRRHISHVVNEDGAVAAHRFVPSKKKDTKFYLTYYPDDNLLKGEIEINGKKAKAETEIDLEPRLFLTYVPDQNLLRGQINIGKAISKGQTKIDLTPKLDLTYYPDDNLLKGQVKIGKATGKGETKIDLTPKLDLTYYPDDNLLKGQVKIGKAIGRGQTEINLLEGLDLEPRVNVSWFEREEKLRVIVAIGNSSDRAEAKITGQRIENFALDYDPRSKFLEHSFKYGDKQLKAKTKIEFPEIKDLKLDWDRNTSKLKGSFLVGRDKLEASVVIPSEIEEPKITLKWNDKRCELTVIVTIGKKTGQAVLKMKCEEILDLLKEIKEKVTIRPTILMGHCEAPSNLGGYSEYADDPASSANGLEEAFTLISQQVKAVHADTCKAISPEVDKPIFPDFKKCQINPETQEAEIVTLSLAEAQTQLGFVAPPLLVGAGKIVLDSVINLGIDFLIRYVESQLNQVIETQCETINDNSPYVLIPDPRAVWNTDDYYLFFKWSLKDPKTRQEKIWNNCTQLAKPINEILNPSDPNTVWDQYFENIYQILGNQWGMIYTANKARRLPLYKGWFASVEEGRRALKQMASLSQLEIRQDNNPKFTVPDNQSVRLTNQNRTIVLRKVVVGRKVTDKDEVEIIREYKRPKR